MVYCLTDRSNTKVVLIVLLCLLTLQPTIVDSGDCYCTVGGTRMLHFGSQLTFVDFRLIPLTDGVPVQEGQEVNCKWHISVDHLSNAVLTMSGFNLSVHMNNRRRVIRSVSSEVEEIKYELRTLDPTSSNCSSNSAKTIESVELDTFRVLQLPRGSYLTVTYRLKSNNPNTPGLRIQLMEPGFCGSETTSFDSSCFTASPTRSSLMDELTALNGDSMVMRLASFNSSSSLHSFVRESQRTRVGSGLSTRSKTPLDLSKRLRIGMFYLPRNQSIFYLRHSGDRCTVEIFNDTSSLNFTVQSESATGVLCGSLSASASVGGDGAIGRVFFGDCNESLSALISFAATARTRCANCSRTVELWMEEARRNSETEIHQQSRVGNGLYIILAVALLLAVCIALFAAVMTLYRGKRNSTFRKKQADPALTLAKAESFQLINQKCEAPNGNSQFDSLLQDPQIFFTMEKHVQRCPSPQPEKF